MPRLYPVGHARRAASWAEDPNSTVLGNDEGRLRVIDLGREADTLVLARQWDSAPCSSTRLVIQTAEFSGGRLANGMSPAPIIRDANLTSPEIPP